VVDLANRLHLRFIGGHPMAGNERPAEKGWDPKLFRDAPFFLCPSRGGTKRDLSAVRLIVRLLGSNPMVADPVEHDRAMALTSHLPALLARRYREFTLRVPAKYCGPGYKSFTRLSRTPRQLLQTFMDSNGDFIRDARGLWRKWQLNH
jgi:prephenate dehydrogenase